MKLNIYPNINKNISIKIQNIDKNLIHNMTKGESQKRKPHYHDECALVPDKHAPSTMGAAEEASRQ